jgi:hypothetical protein
MILVTFKALKPKTKSFEQKSSDIAKSAEEHTEF